MGKWEVPEVYHLSIPTKFHHRQNRKTDGWTTTFLKESKTLTHMPHCVYFKNVVNNYQSRYSLHSQAWLHIGICMNIRHSSWKSIANVNGFKTIGLTHSLWFNITIYNGSVLWPLTPIHAHSKYELWRADDINSHPWGEVSLNWTLILKIHG